MYFPNAFRKSFLPASTTLASSGSTQNLTAGQIGFFKAKDYTVLSSGGVTPFIMAQGSYFVGDKIGPVHGGYQETIKSKVINPKYISRVIKVSGKAPVQQVVKVSATAGLPADTTIRLRLDVKGSPALRFLNHQLYKTLDSYTGFVNTTNSAYVKDPVVSLLAWKDQINAAPFFNQMVSARVYKYVTVLSASSISVAATTTQVTIAMASTTAVTVGQKVIGTGIPANAFVTTVTANTSIVVKYPTQAAAPTISGTVSMQFFDDVYTEASTVAYIPGTAANATPTTAASLGTATGLTSSAYSAAADATSFTYTQAPFIEITAGFLETKFGGCSTNLGTFTASDKYEVEPLVIYASVKDESGDPSLVSAFTSNTSAVSATNPYLSSNGIEVQAPVQAQGLGEAVLREMILDGRYLQNYFHDSSRVDSLRMREIEGDAALLQINRSALYDRVLILHNVPRFNNPSGMFDNDQYLIVIHVPIGTSTTTITNFIIAAVDASQGVGTLAVEPY